MTADVVQFRRRSMARPIAVTVGPPDQIGTIEAEIEYTADEISRAVGGLDRDQRIAVERALDMLVERVTWECTT